jgi:hypothetical protein
MSPCAAEGADVSECALADVLEWLGREQACYTALLDLSRSQRRLLAAGDFALLPDLLARKEELLDELSDIERLLAPLKEAWDDVRFGLTAEDRQRLDTSLGLAEELLADLIASERESERLLTPA